MDSDEFERLNEALDIEHGVEDERVADGDDMDLERPRPWFSLGTLDDWRTKMMAHTCAKQCQCWHKATHPAGGVQKKYGASVETVLANHYDDLERLSLFGRMMYDASLLSELRLGVPANIAARHASGFRGGLKPRVFPFGPVCVPTWCALYGMGEKRLKRLRKLLFRTFPTRVLNEHGNIGRSPPNTRAAEDVELMVKFVLDLARRVGEAHPVRRNSKVNETEDVFFLPANYTVVGLHSGYVEWLKKESGDRKPLSLSTFKRKMRQETRLRRVVVRPPRADVCGYCSILKKQIAARPTNLHRYSDEERVLFEDENRRLADLLDDHTTHATEVRDLMKKRIAVAKSSLALDRGGNGTVELSFTFDYAQNMAIPQMPNQADGPLYFASLRNYYLFGVRDAANDAQFNFIYDEAGEFGGTKNSSNVTSLVYRLLFMTPNTSVLQARRRPSKIHLFAENCTDQNKNETMLWLLLIIAQSSHHRFIDLEQITLTFLPKGHTRNGVDHGFGIIKKRFVKSDVYTLDMAVDLIAQLKGQVAIKTKSSDFRDITKFGRDHKFGSVSGVMREQFFRARRDKPGVIEFKKRRDDEWECKTLVTADQIELLKNFDFDDVARMEQPKLQELKVHDLAHTTLKFIPEQYHIDFLSETPPDRRPSRGTPIARRVARANAKKGKEAASLTTPALTATSTSSSSSSASSTTTITRSEPSRVSERTNTSNSRKRPRCSNCKEIGHNRRKCTRGDEPSPAPTDPHEMDEATDDDESDDSLAFGPARRRRRAEPKTECLDCEETINPLRGSILCEHCSQWVRCHRSHDDTSRSSQHVRLCRTL